MATSKKYNYKANRDEIIQEALELIAVYDPGKTLSSEDISACSRSLRLMIQAFRANDIGLWANKEAALFLQKNIHSYNLGPTGDHCSIAGVKTELANAATSGATSITVDSVSGMSDNFDRDGICTASTPSASGSMTLNGALVSNFVAHLPSQRQVLIYSSGNDSGVTFTIIGRDGVGASVSETITGPNITTVYTAKTFFIVTSVSISGAGTGSIEVGCVGDNVGVELDDGTLHWTYLKAALSTTMDLVTALTGAAAIDNHVYVYDKEIQRPVDIIEARKHDSNDKDTPLILKSRIEYESFSDKISSGTINSIYYDPQLNNGILKIWPACGDVKDYVLMTVRYPLEDVIASTDDFDMPPEWLEVLAWNLATRIAPKYGKQLSSDFIIRAEGIKEILKDSDRENSSIFIQVG